MRCCVHELPVAGTQKTLLARLGCFTGVPIPQGVDNGGCMTVRVQAYDRNGDLYEYEGEELFARAILHENDHLDGLIYTRLVTDPPEGYKEEELEYTEPEDDTEEEK